MTEDEERAMNDHERHYWQLCQWVKTEVKIRRSRYYKSEPWAVLKDLLGHGSTVSSLIWNKYRPWQD